MTNDPTIDKLSQENEQLKTDVNTLTSVKHALYSEMDEVKEYARRAYSILSIAKDNDQLLSITNNDINNALFALGQALKYNYRDNE